MQCNHIEEVIAQKGFSCLPEAARAHAGQCPSCAALLEDFAAIISVASELPAEVDPPSRVWVALRAQMEAEGIIRQSEVVIPAGQVLQTAPPKTPWWLGFGWLLRGRVLATAVVAILVIAAGLTQMRHPAIEPGSAQQSPSEPLAETATTLDQEEQSLGAMQTASTLSVSSVDDSLRENLATVNAFIKECRKRLQEDPNDPMARDYLSTAYQQKAEILAAMMDRGRSVN